MLAQIGDVTRQRVQLCYLTIFPVILPLRCNFKKTPEKLNLWVMVVLAGGVLTMTVSLVVPEKLPGQKQKNTNF